MSLLVQIPSGTPGYLSPPPLGTDISAFSADMFATNYGTAQAPEWNGVFSYSYGRTELAASYNSLEPPFRNVPGYDLHGWFLPELIFLWGKSCHLVGVHRRGHIKKKETKHQNLSKFYVSSHSSRTNLLNQNYLTVSLLGFTCLSERFENNSSDTKNRNTSYVSHNTEAKISEWAFLFHCGLL